jgi:hypothetical protein
VHALAPLGSSRATAMQISSFSGSAREFVETRFLGCFLKNDKFGLVKRHAVYLEQQVAEILAILRVV